MIINKQMPKTDNTPDPIDEKIIDYTHTKKHHVDAIKLRQRRIVTLQKYSEESDTFKLLRTNILKQLRDNNWNSFGITSPTKDAGKSMVAVNLAIAMAMEVNQTVLLIDMDLRNPTVDWYFDIPIKNGLKDYLMYDKPLSDILINPGIDRLVILPGRSHIEGSSEILSGPKMQNLVHEIKNRYKSRIIIFDVPPILAGADVLASMDYFDAMLLVVEDGANNPNEIQKALKILSHTNLLGTILNKAERVPEYQNPY